MNVRIVLQTVLGVCAASAFNKTSTGVENDVDIKDNSASPQSEGDGKCSINKMAADLAFQISKDNTSSIFSPHSILTILNLVWKGSLGTSRKQLEAVLAFGNNESNISIEDKISIKSPGCVRNNQCQDVEFKSETGIFVDTEFDLKQMFLQSLGPNTSLESVNFKSSVEAAEKINSWATQQSRNLTGQVVDPLELTPHTKLILINIIYFRGGWAQEFDRGMTNIEVFRGLNGHTNVPMMHKIGKFNLLIHRELGFVVVELPYSGTNINMKLIIPNEETKDIQAILKHFSESAWDKQCSFDTEYEVLENLEVDIKVPRFNLSVQLNLREKLAEIGVTDIFDAKLANLGGITTKQLYVSQILHAANIQVNEEGTVATGSSKVDIVENRMNSEPTVVHFDRPFIFTISTETDNLPLFVGQVTDLPESGEDDKKADSSLTTAANSRRLNREDFCGQNNPSVGRVKDEARNCREFEKRSRPDQCRNTEKSCKSIEEKNCQEASQLCLISNLQTSLCGEVVFKLLDNINRACAENASESYWGLLQEKLEVFIQMMVEVEMKLKMIFNRTLQHSNIWSTE